MKICLNLLPEGRKMVIARKKRLKNIVKQEVVFLLPVFLFIAILFSINFILDVQNKGIDSVTASIGAQNNFQDLKLYEEGFKNINKRASDINSFQNKHLRWSGVLDVFSETVPEGILLSDFATKEYVIFLVGKAQKRENLVDFQARLGQSGCFENINVPLSNLVDKSNIDFQMDFGVKKECLIETRK